MTTTYAVRIFHSDRHADLDLLRAAIAGELETVGLHRSVTVAVTEADPPDDSPCIGIYLGSPAAVDDAALRTQVIEALSSGLAILPVVADLSEFNAAVCAELRPFNGFEWGNMQDPTRLVRLLLEEIGLEDRQRRVFISHKRDDGLGAAEQLHDALTHAGFTPFIDRFAIRSGRRVQDEIADALEDHAFLLLVETPLAHTSDWVFDEVDYALSHTMGTLILHWPGDIAPVPGSTGLPRRNVTAAELTKDEHDFDRFTEAALDDVIADVEAAHALGLCRRRRMLVQSVLESATAAGASCLPLPDWRLLIEGADGVRTLVGTSPRLPTATDLQSLDVVRQINDPQLAALLVHSARVLRPELQEHLAWVTGERQIVLSPVNAIGAWW